MSAKAVHGVQPGGRYKIRTCDPFRVREVRYHCANRPRRVTTYVIWRTSASAMSPPTRVRHVVSLWNHWFEGRYGGFVCMVGMLPTSDCAPGVAPGIAPSVAPRMRVMAAVGSASSVGDTAVAGAGVLLGGEPAAPSASRPTAVCSAVVVCSRGACWRDFLGCASCSWLCQPA